MRISLLLLSLAAASPAAARPLWQNVETGMNVAQLHALYPAGGNVSYGKDEVVLRNYAVTEKCSADVHIRLASGGVESVLIKGHSALDGHCTEVVLEGLSAKYGQPLTTAPHRTSIFASPGLVYSWNRDGVTLRFTSYRPSLISSPWEIDYAVAEKVPL
ncbi:MAG TPA: hypothetical protein VGF77_02935 [Allosphingosinicella sp.]